MRIFAVITVLALVVPVHAGALPFPDPVWTLTRQDHGGGWIGHGVSKHIPPKVSVTVACAMVGASNFVPFPTWMVYLVDEVPVKNSHETSAGRGALFGVQFDEGPTKWFYENEAYISSSDSGDIPMFGFLELVQKMTQGVARDDLLEIFESDYYNNRWIVREMTRHDNMQIRFWQSDNPLGLSPEILPEAVSLEVSLAGFTEPLLEMLAACDMEIPGITLSGE